MEKQGGENEALPSAAWSSKTQASGGEEGRVRRVATASSPKSLPRALGVMGLRTELLQGKGQTDNSSTKKKERIVVPKDGMCTGEGWAEDPQPEWSDTPPRSLHRAVLTHISAST